MIKEQQNKVPAALSLQAYFAHSSYSNQRGKIDDHIYAILREATGKLYLLLVDKGWKKCLHKPSTFRLPLQQASTFQLSHHLTYEHAYTCVFCSTRSLNASLAKFNKTVSLTSLFSYQ